MNKATRVGIVVVLVVLLAAVAAGFRLWQQHAASEPPLAPPPVEAPPPLPAPVVAKPSEHYPLPDSLARSAVNPLPALNESDPALWRALSWLFGATSLQQLVQPEQIVRRIVVTIDNLPRQTVAARLLPVTPVDGRFAVAGDSATRSIAPENAARYAPYARLADRTDAKKLVAVYARFYPLFQRAYRDLGYPDGDFNTRLVQVIDHLLAAPELDGPLALNQPEVLYQFADADLEACSAGQKILLCMGRANAARIKSKLREIRRELARQ